MEQLIPQNPLLTNSILQPIHPITPKIAFSLQAGLPRHLPLTSEQNPHRYLMCVRNDEIPQM